MKNELGYHLPQARIDNIQSGDLSIHESWTSKPVSFQITFIVRTSTHGYKVGLTFVCNSVKGVYHILDVFKI